MLGIDPGLSRCGYGGVEATRGGGRAVALGVLTTSPDDPLPARLATITLRPGVEWLAGLIDIVLP